VFRIVWYVSFQSRQCGLAAVHAQAPASLMHVFLHGRLGQAKPRGDFLVGQEGGEPQTFFLTRREPLGHARLLRALEGPAKLGERSLPE
jgi:hypothetical protein